MTLQRKTPLRATPLPRSRKPPKRESKRKVADREDYDLTRLAVLDRDQGCMFPHTTCDGRLEVHHVKTRKRGGSDSPSNLLSLCSDAHAWVHAHPLEAHDLGFLRWSWESEAA